MKALFLMKKIKDYALVSGVLTRSISFKVKPEVMQEILRKNPKLLVAMNLGPILGTKAATIALAALY